MSLSDTWKALNSYFCNNLVTGQHFSSLPKQKRPE